MPDGSCWHHGGAQLLTPWRRAAFDTMAAHSFDTMAAHSFDNMAARGLVFNKRYKKVKLLAMGFLLC
jgi:hypothetical protein